MEHIYKEASRIQLRFPTVVGMLTTEQLWGLSFKQLSDSIKVAKTKIVKETDDDFSFLEDVQP